LWEDVVDVELVAQINEAVQDAEEWEGTFVDAALYCNPQGSVERVQTCPHAGRINGN
jgi:hypothetical protein